MASIYLIGTTTGAPPLRGPGCLPSRGKAGSWAKPASLAQQKAPLTGSVNAQYQHVLIALETAQGVAASLVIVSAERIGEAAVNVPEPSAGGIAFGGRPKPGAT